MMYCTNKAFLPFWYAKLRRIVSGLPGWWCCCATAGPSSTCCLAWAWVLAVLVLASASAKDCLVKSVVWLGTNVIVSSTKGEVRHADQGVGVCFGGGSGLLTAPGNPLYCCETTSGVIFHQPNTLA